MEERGLQLNNLRLVLDEYGKDYVDILKMKMRQRDSRGYNRVASGQMLASLKTTTPQNGAVLNVVLHHQPYMKYLEEGTPPHFPPVDAIKEWIRNKNLEVLPDEKGNLPTEDQLAFLIGRKISLAGTAAVPLMQETNEVLDERYRGKLAEALEKDVENVVGEMLIDFKTEFGFK